MRMLSLQFDILKELFKTGMFLPLLVIGNAKESEVMSHDEIPLLQLV